MGRIAVIPGTAGVVIPGAPKISMTAFDKAMARMPGLLHYIDPATLDAHGNGRERFNGTRVVSKNNAVNFKINADPAFNNQPVINVTTSGGGLQVEPGTVTQSMTFVCVASIAEAKRASGTSNLLIGEVPGGSGVDAYSHTFRMSSGGTLSYKSDNDDVTANIISPSTEFRHTPEGDEVALWITSFDAVSKQSAVLWKKDQFNLMTMANAPNVAATERWTYGGLGTSNATLGWLGKLGVGMIFNRALHLPTELGLLQDVMGLLKTKYAIG